MTPYSTLLSDPSGLFSLLHVADVEDLQVLTDYITDSGEGRLSLDSEVCRRLTNARASGTYSTEDRDLVAKEVLLFGGNSIANLYRGLLKTGGLGKAVGSVLPAVAPTPDYLSVVKDVAKQLGVASGDMTDIQEIEAAILLKIFKKAMDKLPEAEKERVLTELGIGSLSQVYKPVVAGAAAYLAMRATTTASLSIASLVAGTVSSQMLGRGLISVPASLGVRPLVALAGPIGWAVGGLWTLAGLSSPAYRVTVPCVVQLAYMRQKYLQEASLRCCPHCSEPNMEASKFCSACGQPL